MPTTSDSNTNHARLFQLRLIPSWRRFVALGDRQGFEGPPPRVPPMLGAMQSPAPHLVFCLTLGRASNPLELFIEFFLGKNQSTGPAMRTMMGVPAQIAVFDQRQHLGLAEPITGFDGRFTSHGRHHVIQPILGVRALFALGQLIDDDS